MSCFWKSVNSEINSRQLQSEYSEVGFLLVEDPMLPFFAIESVLPNSQTLGTDLVFWTVFFPSMRWAKSCQQKHLEASSLNASSCEVQAEFKIKNQMIQSSDIKWYQWAETAASSSYRQTGCVPLREGRVRSSKSLMDDGYFNGWVTDVTVIGHEVQSSPLALAKEPRVPLYLGTLLPYKILQIPTTHYNTNHYNQCGQGELFLWRCLGLIQTDSVGLRWCASWWSAKKHSLGKLRHWSLVLYRPTGPPGSARLPNVCLSQWLVADTGQKNAKGVSMGATSQLF